MQYDACHAALLTLRHDRCFCQYNEYIYIWSCKHLGLNSKDKEKMVGFPYVRATQHRQITVLGRRRDVTLGEVVKQLELLSLDRRTWTQLFYSVI